MIQHNRSMCVAEQAKFRQIVNDTNMRIHMFFFDLNSITATYNQHIHWMDETIMSRNHVGFFISFYTNFENPYAIFRSTIAYSVSVFFSFIVYSWNNANAILDDNIGEVVIFAIYIHFSSSR